MAHTKSGVSTKLGRDSRSKRLGLKVNDGQAVGAGEVIVRQRGTSFIPGRHVSRGGDDTLYAASAGTVKILSRRKERFDGRVRSVKVVTIALKA